jgi:hypothetical protein
MELVFMYLNFQSLSVTRIQAFSSKNVIHYVFSIYLNELFIVCLFLKFVAVC